MKLDQTPIVPTDPAIDSAEGGEDVGLVDAGAFAAFLGSLKEVGEIALPEGALLMPTELLDPELAALEKAAAGEVAVAPAVDVALLASETLNVPTAALLTTQPKVAETPSLHLVSELEPAALAKPTHAGKTLAAPLVEAAAPKTSVVPALQDKGESHEVLSLEGLGDDAEIPPEVVDELLAPLQSATDVPSPTNLALLGKQDAAGVASQKGAASTELTAAASNGTKSVKASALAPNTNVHAQEEGGSEGAELSSQSPDASLSQSSTEGHKKAEKEPVLASNPESALAQRAMEIARSSRGLPEPVQLTVATEGKPDARLATLDKTVVEAPALATHESRETLGRAKMRFGEAEKTAVLAPEQPAAAPEDVSASDLAARSREVRRDALREKMAAPKAVATSVPEARFAAPRVAMSIESATKHAESKAVDAEVRQVASGENASSELRMDELRNREERHEELSSSPEVAQADALIERPVLEVGDAMPAAFDSRDRMMGTTSPLSKGLGIQSENGVQGFFGLHSSESANEAAPVYVQQRLIRTAEAEIDHPELGRIELSMRSEAGGISVKASTRSEIAAAVLSANEGGLRRTSGDRGVAIKNFKVALRNDLSSSEEKSRAAGASRGLLNTEA